MLNNNLKAFLYLLLIRDEITTGTTESIMRNIKKIQEVGGNAIYSNEFLAEYAENLVERLLNS